MSTVFLWLRDSPYPYDLHSLRCSKGKVCPRLLGANRSIIWYNHSDFVFNSWARTLFLPHPSLSFRQVRHSIKMFLELPIFGSHMIVAKPLINHSITHPSSCATDAQCILAQFLCWKWKLRSYVYVQGLCYFQQIEITHTCSAHPNGA